MVSFFVRYVVHVGQALGNAGLFVFVGVGLRPGRGTCYPQMRGEKNEKIHSYTLDYTRVHARGPHWDALRHTPHHWVWAHCALNT